MDLHEAVQLVKKLHSELGSVPRKHHLTAAGLSDANIRKLGGVLTLTDAAGLEPYNGFKPLKITPPIGECEPPPVSDFLLRQLESHVPRECNSESKQGSILVIGDTHFPFVRHDCLEAIYEFNRKMKPAYIVQVGDLYDLYAHSKFPRSLNTYSPQQEEQLGREGAEAMWARLISDNPDAKCFQILGNHDIRPARRVLELSPGFEHVAKKHYLELMTFPGVVTIEDYRQELHIGNIVFHHGYRNQLGAHRDFVRQSFVCGHSHKGGVVYRKMKEETIWELNAGFVGDAESKALSYTSQKINDQTLGWGFVDEYGPRFIPF